MDKIKERLKKLIMPANQDQILPQDKVRGFGQFDLKKILLTAIVIFLILFLITEYFGAWGIAAKSGNVAKMSSGKYLLNALNPFNNRLHAGSFLLLLAVSLIAAVYLSPKLNRTQSPIAYGQKGDSRLTTLKELQAQYPAIPENDQHFTGVGGFPVSHYKHDYFIDQTTSHNLVVGTSRSGKTQMIVLPMIDNLSRASDQSSMVINDPKGELYNQTSQTLEDRGYRVLLLNLANPDKSMAYNPLDLIIKTYERGDQERAMQLINTLSYTLFHKPNAGANEWVYQGAQSACNGMLIALIDYAMEPKNWNDQQKHPEIVNFNNILDMVSNLGQTEVKPGKSLLDLYFEKLPANSYAKREYSSTNLSGEKAKGSILSTVVDGLRMFSLPRFAKMTAQNTLDLRSVGFPKYLSFKVDEDLSGEVIKLKFYHAQNDRGIRLKKTDGTVLDEPTDEFQVQVGNLGFVDFNFDTKLKTGDVFEIDYQHQMWGLQSNTYVLEKKDQSEQLKVTPLKADLEVDKLEINYSDRPTAIFLKIPDEDSSNHALASIFISQLYNEQAKQCGTTISGKTNKRIHFILDEFGNMVPIQNMGEIMTVSAGRNMLFTLIIQSYQQLYSLYGDKNGRTIKENGQNQILVATTDTGTREEFSKAAGNYTADSTNMNSDKNGLTRTFSTNAEKLALITPERIGQIGEGETLVLRALYRQDKKGRTVRPYPIFNTGKTLMPFAYQFLNQTFAMDSNIDPTALMPNAAHAAMNLSDVAVDWQSFVNITDNASEFASPEAEAKAEAAKAEAETAKQQAEDEFNNRVFMKHITELMKAGSITELAFSQLQTAFKNSLEAGNSKEILIALANDGINVNDETRAKMKTEINQDLANN